MKKRQKWVKILAVLVMLVGTVMIFRTDAKLMVTASKLVGIREDIIYYNEQSVKTDGMTERYLELIAERQEFYNSKDTVVGIFSNLNPLAKMGIMLVVAVTFIVIPYMWWILITTEITNAIYLYRKKLRRRSRKHHQRLN